MSRSSMAAIPATAVAKTGLKEPPSPIDQSLETYYQTLKDYQKKMHIEEQLKVLGQAKGLGSQWAAARPSFGGSLDSNLSPITTNHYIKYLEDQVSKKQRYPSFPPPGSCRLQAAEGIKKLQNMRISGDSASITSLPESGRSTPTKETVLSILKTQKKTDSSSENKSVQIANTPLKLRIVDRNVPIIKKKVSLEGGDEEKKKAFNRTKSLPAKKKVCFADTKGQKLTRVRLMSESIDDPPKFLLKKKHVSCSGKIMSGNATKKLEHLSDFKNESGQFKNSKKLNDKIDEIFSQFQIHESDDELDHDLNNQPYGSVGTMGKKDSQNIVKLMEALKSQKSGQNGYNSRRANSLPSGGNAGRSANGKSGAGAATGSPLNFGPQSSLINRGKHIKFQPLFNQPVQSSDLLEQNLKSQNVCLKQAYVDFSRHLKGKILVRNLSLHKDVFIKITFDDWVSSNLVRCSWLRSSLEGDSDIFQIDLNLHDIDVNRLSSSIQSLKNVLKFSFCIKFVCEGQEYWDSLQGRNFTFSQV